MKHFIRLIITCFFVLFGAISLLQLPLTRTHITQWIQKKAKEQGIGLTIERIEGNLPFDWRLKGVAIHLYNQEILLGNIRIRLSILPLFRKQLDISYLKCERGSYNGTSFKGHAQGTIDMGEGCWISISHLLIEGDDLFVRLEGNSPPNLSQFEGNLAFQFPDLGMFSPNVSSGLSMGMAHVSNGRAYLECFANDLSICHRAFAETKLIIHAQCYQPIWKGRALLTSGSAELPIDGTLHFHYLPDDYTFSIKDFSLNGPEMHCFGHIDLNPFHTCLEGTIYAQILDMRPLRPFFPETYLRGKLGAKLAFRSFSTIQEVDCQLEVEEAAVCDYSCETLTIETHLYDIFGDLRGECLVEGSGQFDQIRIDDFEIQSTLESRNSPFTFSVKGQGKAPFQATGGGCWKKITKGIQIHFDDCSGQALHLPIALQGPVDVEWQVNSFTMGQLVMGIGRGVLLGQMDLSKSKSLIDFKATDFPLELIPLRNPHLSLKGYGDLDLDLQATNQQLHGHCHIALKRAVFHTDGSQAPLVTKGSMQVHLQDGKAQIFTQMKAHQDQFIHLTATLPLIYSPLPFKIRLDPHTLLHGQLVAEGRMEDLLDFINIGHHRVEGWISTKLNLSKTLRDFCLLGDFEIQDGMYENYYTGTHLRQLSARGVARNKSIHILELDGQDSTGGTIQATGSIGLDLDGNFPFRIEGEIQDLETVSFDTIAGKFTGNLIISGDKNRSQAEGNLTVSHASFRIPDSLPSALPELPIRFVNPPEIIARGNIALPTVSPMQLDLELDVPAKAFVEGRGMHAELQGKLHITGTYTDIAAKGNLQLIAGEYIFSGKVFDLTSGELIFRNKPTPSAYISVSGNCDLPDVNVSIALRGPLSCPKLTFNSSPQLSTSSLLSQILFNKDVSEINAAQALQLAQTVISLSRTSAPDILEKIRKSLGIDRLTIVTSENEPGKISLQIGKYLMRGVMLTLSQGAESRNVSVELDLKKGVRLQAVVDESQQSKFSLKWHHHY